MSEAILCFGSNLEERAAKLKIKEAIEMMQAGDCMLGEFTPIYPSNSGYYNMVTRISTETNAFDKLNAKCKDIEKALGREPYMKELGIVPIDIDIVIFDGTIMRQLDYDSAYFKHGYAILIKEIIDTERLK